MIRKLLSKKIYADEQENGFTLIELLVVFSIIVVITTVGLASFASYGNGQSLQAAGANVLSMLQTARSRALAEIKPPVCATATLQGYNVSFTVPGRTYALNVLCNNAAYAVTTQQLSSKLVFMAGSTQKIAFNVLDGTANPGQITITNSSGGLAKVVTVDNVGNIKIATTIVPTPTNTPTPTPTFTPTPTPTNTPTPTPTPTPLPALVLSNLVAYDSANASKWSLQTNIQTGNTLYGDRTYTITAIPAALKSSVWVRTANASKTYASNPTVHFTVNRQATVYVGFDIRVTRPSWVDATWTNSGLQMTDSEPVTFTYYKKVFPAGTVSLGNNSSTNQSGVDMYNIIAQ